MVRKIAVILLMTEALMFLSAQNRAPEWDYFRFADPRTSTELGEEFVVEVTIIGMYQFQQWWMVEGLTTNWDSQMGNYKSGMVGMLFAERPKLNTGDDIIAVLKYNDVWERDGIGLVPTFTCEEWE